MINEIATARVKAWVDALESGKYSQIRGHLRSLKGFCSTGVGCDVFDSLKNINSWERTGVSTIFEFRGMNSVCMPKDVQAFFFLQQEAQIITWNDLSHKSFKEIAGLIRENKETLFSVEIGDI